jgi:hypothetical protein
MATEFVRADRQRLEVIAELHHRFHVEAESGKPIIALAAEIRLQEREFGLTPMDRRRLQWEVERGESAAQRTENRRKPVANPAKDPRSVLSVVA